MNILGISAFYHDSAAALLQNGKVIAAAQEERFTRKKHDPAFPGNAAAFCLKSAGLAPQDLDAVVFYDKPFLKFERLLESYYDYAPNGWRSFIASVPVWVKEKLFLKNMLKTELAELGALNPKTQWLFPEHHLSHAASAFFPSPFEEAAILTIDGVGEWCTASVGYGQNQNIQVLSEMHFPHSVGLLYSAFTYYLGFRVNSGEYKLMGLAPYGDPDSEETKRFIHLIKNNMMELFEDGSIWLNQDYFNYATGLTMTRDRAWKKLLGVDRRLPETAFNAQHANLALAIQQVTEEVVLKMAAYAKKLTGSSNLVLSGGVALNCVANGRLLRSGLFKQLYAQPASGDAGGALGAALAAWHIHFKQARKVDPSGKPLHTAYLGPEYAASEIKQALDEQKAVYTHCLTEEDLLETVAGLLNSGLSGGWFQGKMEWGPRALGNRSIIADPRHPEMQKKLNLQVKFRESFRPFAPSVCLDHAPQLFDLEVESPYMLLVAPVRDFEKNTTGGENQSLLERLYNNRASLPAITHVDGSARVQTVSEDQNPRYYRLLKQFQKKSGVPVLINTSFNVRGEPIVNTPEDAYRCFMHTGLDFLVVGNFLMIKSEQPLMPTQTDYVSQWGMD